MKKLLILTLVFCITGIVSAVEDPVCFTISPTTAGPGDDITLTAYDASDNFVDLTEWTGGIETNFWPCDPSGIYQQADPDGTLTFTLTSCWYNNATWDFYVFISDPFQDAALDIAGGSSQFNSVAEAIAAGGTCTLPTDTTPPTPDPMTWATAPAGSTSTAIAMTATTATDQSGVEYQFDETSGNPGGTDSGWQDSTSYTDSGLDPSPTQYCYRVQARDKSVNQNTGGWSTPNACSEPAPAGEILYNGIELPQTWPPQYGSVPYAPMPVPYLNDPPAVVTIDVGRQLFVDDFLIETTDMTQTYHQATMYAGNPVLEPTTILEYHNYSGGMAGPFSGGSWYDPSDSLFKLWYRGAEDSTGTYPVEPMLYATSTDGKNWVRPDTGVLTMSPLHHFTCTPSNPSTGQQVTIAAFDQNNQQVDLSSYNGIEIGWEGSTPYSIDSSSGITFDGNGGAVFTCVDAMFIVQGCEFSYFNEGGTPEAEVFQIPFPFDTLDRGWNVTDPLPAGDEGSLNSTSILLDQNAPASERFKWFSTDFLTTGGAYMRYRTSPDGIDWTTPHSSKIIWGDRSTVFYNPFRDVWVCSQRTEDAPSNGRRNRGYTEGTSAADLMSKIQYNEADTATAPSVHWVGADPLDPRHTDPLWDYIEPELYTLDAMPYESLMLGQFSIWTGPTNADCDVYWVPKRCDILLGFSRDGFHWDRPDRTRFISSTWD
ncbi:MAG: hypothetical protein ACYTFK_14110, partial [Planctomycetota bacterium]